MTAQNSHRLNYVTWIWTGLQATAEQLYATACLHCGTFKPHLFTSHAFNLCWYANSASITFFEGHKKCLPLTCEALAKFALHRSWSCVERKLFQSCDIDMYPFRNISLLAYCASLSKACIMGSHANIVGAWIALATMGQILGAAAS